MAEDDQATARHGGLDVEITVEEPPARVKRASEPSGPIQTDAADPQDPPQEPSQEDADEGSDGDGEVQGPNRLTALIGKLRDKARREGDEPDVAAEEATADTDPALEQADKRPTVQASGFTVLSYRSGPGRNGDPPVPGRQTITAPEEQPTAPDEPEEPEQVHQAPETAEIEQPDPGMTEAPPLPADDVETSDPGDEVAIEMEEPAAEVVEPDQAPVEEALEAEAEPEATEEVEQTEDAEESPGFLAGLRDRFSSDDDPAEEALEAEDSPEPEEETDGPSLFTRLRSKLSRSKADAIEVPTAMPAPPPAPPVATAEVEVTEEPEDAGDAEEAEDSPGLFARLTGKASDDEEPEQAPDLEPATDQAPAKKGGLFSRLKDKVSRSGSSIEDPIAAELDQPPTPPTGHRQPEIIAAIGQASEPTASDLESLEATIDAVEADETPEPEPATAEADEEPAKKGGLFSRLKDKVTGSDEEPEDQVADEPGEAPAPATPIEHPHEGAVEGAPEVPPTGDRHPELITAMSTDSQTVEEPEEPDTVAADAETGEEPAEKGGLFSRLKDKVTGSDEEPEDQVADEPEPTEAPEPEALEAEEPPSTEADEEPAEKDGLFSRLKNKVAGSEDDADAEPEADEAAGPDQAPEPSAVETEEPDTVETEDPVPLEAETSEPSEPGPVVAEAPEPGPEAVKAGEDPEPAQPATAEVDHAETPRAGTATDEASDPATEPAGDDELPYDEIVRRVEILLARRREDPEKSAAREKVRILAGGSER